MTRHCEHCTFWKGNEGSSRAECGNEDVMGTTAYNDTCKHFNAKAWASNPQIDESGKIIGKVNAGGGLIWSNHQTSVAPGTPIYFDGSGRLTTIPDKGVAPADIMGSDGKVITKGSTVIQVRGQPIIDIDDGHIGNWIDIGPIMICETPGYTRADHERNVRMHIAWATRDPRFCNADEWRELKDGNNV